MANNLPIVSEPLPSDRSRGPEPEVLPVNAVDPDRCPQGDAYVARQHAARIDPQDPLGGRTNPYKAWAEELAAARAARAAARSGGRTE
jgi:hypothetical protein